MEPNKENSDSEQERKLSERFTRDPDRKVFCNKCGCECSLKFNSGDPVWVCDNDDCRRMVQYEDGTKYH